MKFFYNNKTRHLLTLFLYILYPYCSVYSQDSSTSHRQNSRDYLSEAQNLQFSKPDSAVILFKLEYKQSLNNGDTAKAIQSLVGLSSQYVHNANFGEAYDNYWEALLLSDKINNPASKASVYFGLAWLYSLYERNEEAERYFKQVLSINKKRIKEQNLDKSILLDSYYSLATLYRKLKDHSKAKIYLDSCRLTQDFENNLKTSTSFINAELAYNYHEEGNNEKALELLLPLDSYFSKVHRSYLAIYHAKLADIYYEMGQKRKSEQYYQSAIRTGLKHKSHLDFIPDVYEKYSKLLIELGDYKKAYSMLKKAKDMSEKHFGSRNSKNRQFLEIKDLYRQEQENKKKALQEQKLQHLEQEDKIWYFKTLLAYSTIAFLILLFFLIYRHFRNKHKAEKRLLNERQKLEQEKTREIIEIKNRELTSSALQLIERDEMLEELKVQLKEQGKKPDTNKLNKLAKSININTGNNWKEFEARFIQVNGSFYKKLNEKFPKLTQGDQKICALIKLNFSSKEMSHLLGISIESVHTTRYRLRKKLGLSRSDNLEEFIGTFENE